MLAWTQSLQWQCEVCDMVTDNSSRCRDGVELLGADSAAPPPVVCSVADTAPWPASWSGSSEATGATASRWSTAASTSTRRGTPACSCPGSSRAGSPRNMVSGNQFSKHCSNGYCPDSGYKMQCRVEPDILKTKPHQIHTKTQMMLTSKVIVYD